MRPPADASLATTETPDIVLHSPPGAECPRARRFRRPPDHLTAATAVTRLAKIKTGWTLYRLICNNQIDSDRMVSLAGRDQPKHLQLTRTRAQLRPAQLVEATGTVKQDPTSEPMRTARMQYRRARQASSS